MTDDNLSAKARDLLAFIAERGYVCPWGKAWDDLYKLLQKTRRADGAQGPSLPLILAGWYASSNLDKLLRLREHIEWADKHGVIDKVDKYLRNLPPEQWHPQKPKDIKEPSSSPPSNPLAQTRAVSDARLEKSGFIIKEQTPPSKPPMTLQEANESIRQHLKSLGFTEKEASPTTSYTARFIPQRSPVAPPLNPVSDDGKATAETQPKQDGEAD